MPIPGSIFGSLISLTNGELTDVLYPSLATLRPVTDTTSSTGQLTHTFADSTDPVQQNLKCRKSPLILVRPKDDEITRPDGTHFVNRYQVNFAAFINIAPEVLCRWQIKIDGVVYHVITAEADGNSLTSRLEVLQAAPFLG